MGSEMCIRDSLLTSQPNSDPSSYPRTRPYTTSSFRQFLPSWCSGRPWLHYSISRDQLSSLVGGVFRPEVGVAPQNFSTRYARHRFRYPLSQIRDPPLLLAFALEGTGLRDYTVPLATELHTTYRICTWSCSACPSYVYQHSLDLVRSY